MASHDAPGSTLTVFSSMQGVRAPTDPSHWHAATRVLPRPASSGSVDPRGTCIERGSRRVPARRQPLLSRRGATTSSPHSPPVRSIQHLPKLAGRLLAAQMAMDPSNSNCGTAPRLLTHSSSAPQARPTKMVHLRHNQRWCTFGTTMMVHLRHNQAAAPQELIGKAPAPATLRALSWLPSMT